MIRRGKHKIRVPRPLSIHCGSESARNLGCILLLV